MQFRNYFLKFTLKLFRKQIGKSTSALLIAALFSTIVQPLAAAPLPSAGLLAPVAQETPTSEPQSEQVTATLDQLDSLLIELAGQVDRSQFDLDELSFSLGFDAKDIIAFVRDGIAFEQYPGLLRGAQGTLMSRAGNALDEAILLQTLLVDAGYDARIAHGTLPTAQATRLLRQMIQPRKPAPSPVKDMAQFQDLLGQMLDLGAIDEAGKDALLKQVQEPVAVGESLQYQQALTETNFVLDTLQANGIKVGDTDAAAKLRSEAQDYFWVEYRLGPADEWTQAHPAFKSGSAPSDLEATESFDAEIPDVLKQQVQFQVSIERSSGDQTETVPIMDPWQSSVADLIGQAHNFALYADGLTDSADFANLHKAYAATLYFFPLLDGKLPAGALFFDSSGKTVSPAEASSPFAQIGGAISSTITSAISAFSTETTTVASAAPSQLTAVWMEYTFLMPDGSQKSERRVIWQQGDGPASVQGKLTDDEKYEMGRQLTASYDFMLAAGAYPAAYRLDQTINQLLDLRPMLNIVAQDLATPTAQVNDFTSLPLPSSGWTGHLSIFSIFDLLPPSKGTVSYLSEPLLVQHRQTLGDGSLIQAGIDIVNNGRRAYSSAGRDLAAAAKDALRAGVWETVTEGLVLPDEVRARQNTATVFDAAQTQGITLTVLTPDKPVSLEAMKWNGATKAAIGRDLAAGYLVIAPAEQPTGQDLMAWWRVNPQTGETLGLGTLATGGGGGPDMAEYVITNVGPFVSLGGCLAIAAADENGVTYRDLLVCGGTVVSLGLGPIGSVLAASKLGVTIAAAVAAVIGSFTAGVWLNTSPSLDK